MMDDKEVEEFLTDLGSRAVAALEKLADAVTSVSETMRKMRKDK